MPPSLDHLGSDERTRKRTAILFAVWRIIATRGMGAVSFRSVATEAEVSLGRVQHYFATKDDLIRASVDLMITGAEAMHRTATAEADPADELWHLLAHAIPQAAESPVATSVFYSFVAASVADPHIARTLADAKQGSAQEIAGLLCRLTAPAPDVEETARELLSMSDGATLGVLIGSLTPDQARATLRVALDRALGR